MSWTSGASSGQRVSPKEQRSSPHCRLTVLNSQQVSFTPQDTLFLGSLAPTTIVVLLLFSFPIPPKQPFVFDLPQLQVPWCCVFQQFTFTGVKTIACVRKGRCGEFPMHMYTCKKQHCFVLSAISSRQNAMRNVYCG